MSPQEYFYAEAESCLAAWLKYACCFFLEHTLNCISFFMAWKKNSKNRTNILTQNRSLIPHSDYLKRILIFFERPSMESPVELALRALKSFKQDPHYGFLKPKDSYKIDSKTFGLFAQNYQVFEEKVLEPLMKSCSQAVSILLAHGFEKCPLKNLTNVKNCSKSRVAKLTARTFNFFSKNEETKLSKNKKHKVSKDQLKMYIQLAAWVKTFDSMANERQIVTFSNIEAIYLAARIIYLSKLNSAPRPKYEDDFVDRRGRMYELPNPCF